MSVVDPDWDPATRALTTQEAAELVDRSTSVIRRWSTEGTLTPVAWQRRTGRGPSRVPLYLELDVLVADSLHRTAAQRSGRSRSAGRHVAGPGPVDERGDGRAQCDHSG